MNEGMIGDVTFDKKKITLLNFQFKVLVTKPTGSLL